MEVLKLGLSVLWMDMDIYFHASPFNFFTSLPTDADFVIQTELWDHTHSFRGERGFERVAKGVTSTAAGVRVGRMVSKGGQGKAEWLRCAVIWR